ncbi:GAD-like domain-containing protein [Litoreibacter janthinus]|uniref:GAD-like domain-containing protein n=1 Tax=Litoreibacter janthinus TaxID=670154 RepID=A0A1I6FVW3_9RHOB|nr:GAD-like domain-containing protein [Litoreibacter janthinus]SFR34048.1 GAD-like domain-containing protein [Litoreibacter janthinus]
MTDSNAEIPVDAVTIARYANILPDALLDVWRNSGLCSIAGGRMQLIVPDMFASLTSYIFEGDPDLAGDTYAIAYGALGEVVFWSGRHGFGFLAPGLATLDMPYILDPTPPTGDAQIAQDLLTFPATGIESFDPAGAPVFERLQARFRPLPFGAIYGTTPVPPSLAGTPVEHYVVAEAADWLEAVYTNINITLVDWSRQPSELRRVGQPWPKGGPVAAIREERL